LQSFQFEFLLYISLNRFITETDIINFTFLIKTVNNIIINRGAKPKAVFHMMGLFLGGIYYG